MVWFGVYSFALVWLFHPSLASGPTFRLFDLGGGCMAGGFWSSTIGYREQRQASGNVWELAGFFVRSSWVAVYVSFLAATDQVEAELDGTRSACLAEARLGLFDFRQWKAGSRLRIGCQRAHAEQTLLSGCLAVSHQLTVTPRETQHRKTTDHSHFISAALVYRKQSRDGGLDKNNTVFRGRMEQVIIGMVEGGGQGGGHITTPAEGFGPVFHSFLPGLIGGRDGVGRFFFFIFERGTGGRRWTELPGGHLSGAFVLFSFSPFISCKDTTRRHTRSLSGLTLHHLHTTPIYLPLGHTLNTNSSSLAWLAAALFLVVLFDSVGLSSGAGSAWFACWREVRGLGLCVSCGSGGCPLFT